MNLDAKARKAMPSGDFAGPDKSFPISDPEHARLAVGGATRSEHAGNISESTADAIKAKARKKLGIKTKMNAAHPGIEKGFRMS